jgi:DNA-binding NarL/FixJ family response regulator
LLRIFIVDDVPDFVEGFSALLTASLDCEVVGRAASQALALEWSFAHEAGFDVAIVDLLLSEGSGFAVLAHLHKYQPGKLVVLSEFVSPVMEERCRRLGAVAAFQKSRTQDCIDFIRTLAPGG